MLNQTQIGCPYCGEAIQVLVDEQEVGHEYIEDCQVCCRPITFSISMAPNGGLTIAVYDENDSF